jgi:hypothetical protein
VTVYQLFIDFTKVSLSGFKYYATFFRFVTAIKLVRLITVHLNKVYSKVHIAIHLGFEILTAVSMKMVVFWVVVPPSSGPYDGGSKDL